ncbi:MAG: peptidoglycan-associated lipoprotein [Rhodocyclales bacterium RIFCSPLOWO2_02_FULL_63_24]|nr:MAG: peptidoglycan-associated lipoprotein [Rhodocyclales bacterium RIFCSPLOWO2_02_FULL_63_24]
MRISSSMFAALVISLAGCAATENKTGEAVRPQQPVPDKVPAVATAIPRATASEGDDLSAIRDPNNPLSKRSIYFDFDNYEVKSEYAALLERHGRFLAEKPAVKIMVQGHADERGSHEYNLALGQKRAEAVRRTLLLQGAKDGQLEAVSFGEEKPGDAGHSEAAWALNRRADIVYPVKQ